MSFFRIKNLKQGHMAYPGFRATVRIKLLKGRLSDNLQIDIGVGDQVELQNRRSNFLNIRQTLYEDTVSLQVYSVEAIFAEKLETGFSEGRPEQSHEGLSRFCHADSQAGTHRSKNFGSRNTHSF